MCGIAGIHAYGASAARVERIELLRIRDHMARRGPDGEGLWVADNGRIALAHRRLAIIDLTASGAQPMASADGRYVITCNGEIYNYRQLRAELEAAGTMFRSQSDTEVLLHLFAQRGSGMLDALRGMFAIAIWDTLEHKLFLARDAFGIKPLYYADDGRTLRFASQVKALLAGGAVDTTPQPAGHAGFFLWGSVPEPWTLYRGISALPAGHVLVADRNGVRAPVPWCSVSEILAAAAAAPAHGDRETAIAAIVEAGRDSIRAHTVADVPIGVFLSAGLDSAFVASAAVAQASRSFTLTLGFAEYKGTDDDEVPMAEELARLIGAWHTTLLASRGDFEQERERLLAAMDQPSIDGVNTWFVARAAAKMELKVALSGLGGDELFGSYPSFRQVPLLARWGAPFARAPAFGRAVRRISSPLLRHMTSPKYAGLVEYSRSLGSAYLLRRCVYAPWELPGPLEPAFMREGLEQLRTVEQLDASVAGNRSEPLAVSALEMGWYMRNQLLRDADWAGMAQAVEIRVPFVDLTLLRETAPWLAAHPDITKAEIVGAAMPAIPPAILARPKTGFSVPVRDWLITDPSRRPQRGMRGWAQFIHQRFGDGGRIRVLLLTTDAYGSNGGIALYNRDQIEALAAMPEITEITVVARHAPLPVGDLPDKVNFLAAATGGKVRYVATAWRASRRHHHLVICGHINLLPLAVLLRTFQRAPLVLMAYGIDVWQSPRALSRRWLSGVDRIWAISALTRDRMNAWAQLPEDRYRLLPNGIHLDRYGMGVKRPDLVARYGLAGARVIMTLARLPGVERYKGVDEVLEVMPSLAALEPSIRYLVCGDGDDRPRLEAKARALGIAGRVIFTGAIPEPEKADHFRLADAFVMPGRGEGFGFVYLEALACGVPAVGSTLDGSREALRDGQLGILTDPDDRDALREAIVAALARTKGIPAGLEYFAWPAFCARLAQAVRGVLGRSVEHCQVSSLPGPAARPRDHACPEPVDALR